LLPDGWADGVEIGIDESGDIDRVITGVAYTSGDRAGALIPGIPNLHSHAHQRAMSGLGERAGESKDSFWSWRKVMYHYLERIEPQHLHHIAALLYLEMLKAGYTAVCEFQYLHHAPNGQPYATEAEMSLQCLWAAAEVGIGFTALPVLYRYSGFGNKDPLPEQARFVNDEPGFTRIVEALQAASREDPNTAVGIAPHSLRAVSGELLTSVLKNTGLDDLAAIHIHIAEQTGEVEDCLAWSEQRPVEWLLNRFQVDEKWCLVHATHTTDRETQEMAGSGCVAGLCPTTEANLGDGFFDAVDYFHAGGRWGIGSDSHISISPVEELRWLEYGQRLVGNSRNVLVSPRHPNTGRNLLGGALQGGAQACGRKLGRIEPGYRADFVALDNRHPRLYGRGLDSLLDSWIFSGNENAVRSVYVGGQKVIDQGRHAREETIVSNFFSTLDQLAH
jgi:formimidoylglutamate deiminase